MHGATARGGVLDPLQLNIMQKIQLSGGEILMRTLLFHFLTTESSMALLPFRKLTLSPSIFFSLVSPDELWDVSMEQTNISVVQKQRRKWLRYTSRCH